MPPPLRSPLLTALTARRVVVQVTNDGHRFRFESLNHDQPKGSLHWDQSFIDLIDLPGYGHQPPPDDGILCVS